MRISATGSSGFSLLELLAALTIAGFLLAVAVPSGTRFYESMQLRQAVRDSMTLFLSARQRALQSGRPQDVLVYPQQRLLRLGEETRQLPGKFRVSVTGARELNRERAGVIRFYPEGGASGGEMTLENPGSGGTRILVDWLAGRVTQERYDVR